MSGDFSRETFDPRKHYSGVRQQQGRVQLDADWNEQLAIQQHRTQTEALDVIGPCGVPQASDGFKIGGTSDSTDLTMSPGRIYVDGLMCELEATPVSIVEFVQNNPAQAVLQTMVVDGRTFQAGQWIEILADDKPKKIFRIVDVDSDQNILSLHADITEYHNSVVPTVRRITTYMTQPDYPHPDPLILPSSPPTSVAGDGTYVVFLDVWQRDVTALDDPHIREVALGGPDTTTRIKNVWQLQLLPVSAGITSPPTSPPSGEVTCQTRFVEWDQRTAPSTGMLNVRTTISSTAKDPCLLPPNSGYRRIENQLYRVEVHTGGTLDQATFKWSRENASVVTTVERIAGDEIMVTDIGKDEVLGFAATQWVEIVDEESELKQTPHPLFQIKNVKSETRGISLVQSAAFFQDRTHRKLRRWDQTGLGATPDGVKMVGGWIDLEDGLQVLFSEGEYHPGDYWLIPARTATGEIEWPPFKNPNEHPLPQQPLGIRHHYCRLALLKIFHGVLSFVDCRKTFPPLTELPGSVPVEEPGIGITAIGSIADGKPLLPDVLVPVSRLAEGLTIVCNKSLAKEPFGGVPSEPPFSSRNSIPAKPTCFVTLDLPYPFLGAEKDVWETGDVVGVQPLILVSTVTIQGNVIEWRPTGGVSFWLQKRLFQKLNIQKSADRILAHLTLKGNFIWSNESGTEQAMYLDGEGFGSSRDGRVDIRFPTGNGRRGGDFEMWFWLRPIPIVIEVEPILNRRIAGTLHSSLGVPLVGATVTLTGPPETIFTATTERGHFDFLLDFNAAGTYVITAQFEGDTASLSITV